MIKIRANFGNSVYEWVYISTDGNYEVVYNPITMRWLPDKIIVEYEYGTYKYKAIYTKVDEDREYRPKEGGC